MRELQKLAKKILLYKMNLPDTDFPEEPFELSNTLEHSSRRWFFVCLCPFVFFVIVTVPFE